MCLLYKHTDGFVQLVVDITTVFLLVGKRYKKHINQHHPFQVKGSLAETYGNLLEIIWSRMSAALSLDQFILAIASDQISGDKEHDPHDFLVFLLNKLHEELNLAKMSEHLETNGEGESDKVKFRLNLTIAYY